MTRMSKTLFFFLSVILFFASGLGWHRYHERTYPKPYLWPPPKNDTTSSPQYNLVPFPVSGQKPNADFHDCEFAGSEANGEGYQTLEVSYRCKEGYIHVHGKWSEEIQNGWEYETEFGGPTGREPRFVGSDFPKIQKWCKNDYGYSLCGLQP